MQARLLLHERQAIGENRSADIVIWQVPRGVRGSAHDYKYRLAFVVDEICVPRFDNEARKGDHKHIGETEVPVVFVDLRQLASDFWDEVGRWRPV
jgi:hypothetical protein